MRLFYPAVVQGRTPHILALRACALALFDARHVNWRPQVLIIYSIPNTQEARGLPVSTKSVKHSYPFVSPPARIRRQQTLSREDEDAPDSDGSSPGAGLKEAI